MIPNLHVEEFAQPITCQQNKTSRWVFTYVISVKLLLLSAVNQSPNFVSQGCKMADRSLCKFAAARIAVRCESVAAL